MTCGDKGYNEWTTTQNISSDDLCALRHREQMEAATVIGAKAVHFLDRPDGYLVPDIDLRREVVGSGRLALDPRCDPKLLTLRSIIRPPGRGRAVMDAVFLPQQRGHFRSP
jgi:LmbE family N-acetylglucosaminyl deacetylase